MQHLQNSVMQSYYWRGHPLGLLLQGARGTRLTASAVTIQAAYRGMAARRELRRARAAASKIQVSTCPAAVSFSRQ